MPETPDPTALNPASRAYPDPEPGLAATYRPTVAMELGMIFDPAARQNASLTGRDLRKGGVKAFRAGAPGQELRTRLASAATLLGVAAAAALIAFQITRP